MSDEGIDDLYRRYHGGKYEGLGDKNMPQVIPEGTLDRNQHQVFSESPSKVDQDYTDAETYRKAGIKAAGEALGPEERQVAIDMAMKAIKVQKKIREVAREVKARRDRAYPKKVDF